VKGGSGGRDGCDWGESGDGGRGGFFFLAQIIEGADALEGDDEVDGVGYGGDKEGKNDYGQDRVLATGGEVVGTAGGGKRGGAGTGVEVLVVFGGDGIGGMEAIGEVADIDAKEAGVEKEEALRVGHAGEVGVVVVFEVDELVGTDAGDAGSLLYG
jgi:hypothetical protein